MAGGRAGVPAEGAALLRPGRAGGPREREVGHGEEEQDPLLLPSIWWAQGLISNGPFVQDKKGAAYLWAAKA